LISGHLLCPYHLIFFDVKIKEELVFDKTIIFICMYLGDASAIYQQDCRKEIKILSHREMKAKQLSQIILEMKELKTVQEK
jgi:hypothetical protein